MFQTGLVPAVTAFEAICIFDPVGWLATDGLLTVTVNGDADIGKLSGRVTIKEVDEDLITDLAGVEVYPLPVNETETFVAKFPPVIVIVSLAFAINEGVILLINGPDVISEVVFAVT